MGGRFRITTDDGQDLYFPEENAVAAMKALDRKGVKYIDARIAPDTEGTVTAGEPEAVKVGPPQVIPAPAEKPSALAQLGSILAGHEDSATQREDAMGGAGDALGVLSGGWTGKLDQRLPFVGQDIKAAREGAAERLGKPVATALDLAGAVTSPIGLEGKAGTTAAALASRIGAASATGGMQSVSRSLGEANPDDDLKTQAMQALAAGEKGTAYGAGAGVLGESVGALAQPLDRATVALRRNAFGGTAGDNQALIEEMGTRKGLEFIEKDLGRIPERQGLTNVIIPQSASGLAKRAADRNKLVNGPAIGDSLSDAGYQLTPQPQPPGQWHPPQKAPIVNRGQIDAQLAEQAKIAKESPELTGQDASNFVEARGRLRNQTVTTPTDLQRLKNRYESGAYAPGSVAGSMESSAAKVNAEAARATREHLDDVMSQADPATYAKFKRANADYGDTAMVENMARAHAARGLAAPLLGAGLGGVLGYEIRKDTGDALMGAAAGGVAGRTYGPDLAANVARLGEQGASAVGGSTPALAKLGGALASSEPRASAQDAAGDTRGHLIPQAIQDALRDNKLGPYSDEFARAAMAPEPGALGVTYSRLSKDPQFAPYKRLLQEMTGDMP